MTTRIYTAEFSQEKKVTIKAFSAKNDAVAWARERVQQDNVSAITIWENAGSAPPRDLLVIAAEGKQWYDARRVVAIIARKGARVMR
jgi:hypothetical protein